MNNPMILYGAGNLGKMAKEYFDKLNIPYLFFMDKNPKICRKDEFWKDTRIVDLNGNIQDFVKKNSLVVVCIVNNSYKEIESDLKEHGWNNIIPFYDITLEYQDKHPLNNGWNVGVLEEIDQYGIEYVLFKFNDYISKAHYCQFILWHKSRKEHNFKDAPIINENRYFIPEITSILNEKETFVDIGAHHGEVLQKFIKIVNNKFNSIYAIEPDEYNFFRLCINKEHNIHVIKKALGENKELKKFYSGFNYASQLSELGKEIIEVEKLDNLNIKATFIKIHTEGNEDDIIRGGLKTITKYRPIIVSSVYHNRKGLWKIQKLLMDSLKDYIFYFRLHSWCGTSAIIYAIPKERI